jgi:hypothetical protein
MRIEVWQQYIIAKWSTALVKGIMWLYYNTPMGAHPSPAERIKNAQHIAEQQEKMLQNIGLI